jgi:hypothetical protein
MAVAFKVNSPEGARTDFQPKRSLDPKEGLAFSSSYIQSLNDLSIDAVVDSLGQQYRVARVYKTSSQGRASDLRRIAIQSELFTALSQDSILDLPRLKSDRSSVSPTRYSPAQFDESYSKLGRWRLKGTDELRAAEDNLLSSERNFYMLAMKSLDEDDVEVFNHIRWLLSKEPMATVKILTAELLRRIADHNKLTVDQWINGLEILAYLPERYLAMSAPLVRHILLAAPRDEDEDILFAANKLAKGLPLETLEDEIYQWREAALNAPSGEDSLAPRAY